MINIFKGFPFGWCTVEFQLCLIGVLNLLEIIIHQNSQIFISVCYFIQIYFTRGDIVEVMRHLGYFFVDSENNQFIDDFVFPLLQWDIQLCRY